MAAAASAAPVGAASGAAPPSAADELRSVMVQFVSKEPQRHPRPVPSLPLSVPAELARKGLSEVVNHLAGQVPPRPYEFLVEGEFLRSSLKAWFAAKRRSPESVVVLEYVEAMPEPRVEQASEHPDWVSALDCRGGLVLTGCYDGVVRVFRGGSLDEPLAVAAGHRGAVKGVAWLGPWWVEEEEDEEEEEGEEDKKKDKEAEKGDGARARQKAKAKAGPSLLVSASKDHSLRVWRLAGAACELQARCLGHMDSVECVASAGDGHRFLSGGWDGGILLWDARDAGTAPKPEPKKRRAGDAAAASAAAATVHAVTRFVGHRGAVTAVTWPHPAAIYSGSWDHTVVRWDAASQASVSTWNAGSVVSDLAFSILANAIATAHHDGTIRIWDPRTSEQENLRQTLRSHTGWATAVDWSPSSPFLLASTAHDGTVKLWDTRARSPLHSLAQHAGPGGAVEKGLCLAWLDASHALSGGSDKRLRAFVLSDARAEEQREPVAEAAAARGDAAEMRDEESVPARPARKRRQPKP